MNPSAFQPPPAWVVHDDRLAALSRGVASPEGPEGHELPPALAINPIGAAYRPASRLASLGVAVLVWGALVGGGVLLVRVQATRAHAAGAAPQAVNILLLETEKLNLDAGGHQGGGQAPPAPSRPAATPEAPPPPPMRELPEDMATPTTLPTLPAAPPPPSGAAGVPGGTGTGSGVGTGSGFGLGTGGGTGSGEGAGAGVQSQEPLVVPYSQIGFLKVVNPEYPERARRVGLQGEVVVRVTIDETGRPVELHVVGGEPILVKETLKVLPHWRFTPVLHLGKRVKATFDAVLHFNLA